MPDGLFAFPRKKREVRICDDRVTLYTRDTVAKEVWNYRFRLPDGTEERKSTRTTDLERAKKVASDRYNDVVWRAERNLSVRKTTLGQAATAYVEHLRRLNQRTNKEPQSRRNQIDKLEKYVIPRLGSLDVTLLTQKHVSDFLNWYEDEYQRNLHVKQPLLVTKDRKGDRLAKPRVQMTLGGHRRPPTELTRRLFERLIRLVCEHAVQERLITPGERPDIQITPMGKYHRGGFDEHEETWLLRHLEQRINEVSDRNHVSARRLLWLYTRFHILTGLRPGEESKDLRFSDVELRGNELAHYLVHVRKGKRGARKVIADAELGEVVRLLREHHPAYNRDAYLWVRADGTKIQSFVRVFLQVLDELKLRKDADGKPRSLYSLRHTYCTKAIYRNVNTTLLAKNMGTSVTQITAHYEHVLHTQQVHMLLGYQQTS